MENERLKILMTTDTLGGVWTYTHELCNILGRYGAEVHLAAMGSWPTVAQRKEMEELGNVTLYRSNYKLEWMDDPWEDIKEANKWITSIYHTVQPNLVHFNNYALIENYWDCPIVTVYHSCVNTWWQAVKGTDAPQRWDRYRSLVKSSLNASDVVVFPTLTLLQKAILTHGISSPVTVIHNGREIHFPFLKKKEPFILCTGRIWDEAKNLHSLAKMANRLPWPIYVAGNNIHPVTGQKMEVENLKFLGNLSSEELKSWMHRASIYVSPAKYEPFGLGILEAALAECALALGSIGSLQELWWDHADFFDPDDVDDMEATLLKLIENRPYRIQMAEKALKKAGEFGVDKMGAEYIKLYRKLLWEKTHKNKIGITVENNHSNELF